MLAAAAPVSAGLIIDTSASTAQAGQIGDFGLSGNLNNDVVKSQYGAGTILDGFFGANLAVDQDTFVKVEFVGKEAYYINTLVFGGSQISNQASAGSSITVGTLAGLLNFIINVDMTHDGITNRSVANGANNDQSLAGLADFWLGWDPLNPGAVLLALDDGGASPDDDNHDDLVLRITDVPEPAPLALLGLSIMALGLARRQSRS